MSLDREILVRKWPIFAPCLVHISDKRHGIELKILPQPPHFSPTYALNFSPFERT